MKLKSTTNDLPSTKLLCIIGPTGTGKTALAVKIGKEVPSVLISADSRQIYRGMDIVTGKDHPQDLALFGIDLVDPDDDFSVSQWHDAVLPVIKSAQAKNLLPIVVGGTGLYVSSLVNSIDTMHVPINKGLREELELLPVIELQAKLSKFSSARFTNMNYSDQHNPRRLIRAIEVEKYNASNPSIHNLPSTTYNLTPTIVGLLPPTDPEVYRADIQSRVAKRLEGGAIEETQRLLQKYPLGIPAFTSIGYGPIIRFLNNEISREQMIGEWTQGEISYAKRQLLYMRKLAGVEWYDKSIQENNLWKSKISI